MKRERTQRKEDSPEPPRRSTRRRLGQTEDPTVTESSSSTESRPEVQDQSLERDSVPVVPPNPPSSLETSPLDKTEALPGSVSVVSRETPSSQGLRVQNIHSWSGTLALVNKKDGLPYSIGTLSAYPEIRPCEKDSIESIFQFRTWPLHLEVRGVCPIRDVVAHCRGRSRVVLFKVLHELPPKSDPLKMVVKELGTPEQSSSNAPPQQTYFSMMLGQILRKGIACVVQLPNHTLFFVNNRNQLQGFIIPKVELKIRPQDPITAPPPTPGCAQCISCLESPAIYALIPCGHLCLCHECLGKYRSSSRGDTCPVCRQETRSNIRIFST